MFLNYYHHHHHYSLSRLLLSRPLSRATLITRRCSTSSSGKCRGGFSRAGINSRAQPSGWMRYADVQKRRRVRCIRGIPR